MTRLALLAVVIMAVTACQSTTETETRKIELPPKTVISVVVTGDGGMEAEVTVPSGHADAGTYVTTSKALHDDLVDAQKNLGQPGTRAWIEVNRENEIVAVTNRTTKQ